MRYQKLFILLLIVISFPLSLDAMQRKPSRTVLVPMLVEEDGQKVCKLAIRTGNYNPNPRLDLIIQEPFPEIDHVPSKENIYRKFPGEFKLTLSLCFAYLKKPHLFKKTKASMPNTFLLHGNIEKDALYLAQLIHQEFQLPFVHVYGHQFLDNYNSIGARKVDRALQTRDPKGRPLLLFIDDFDPIAAIPPSDTDYNTEYQWRMSKSSFRFDFDHLEHDSSIILLVSTKNKYNLDEGIISRFAGYNIGIKSMTYQERKLLLTTLCTDLIIEDKENTISALASASKGLSRKSLTDVIYETSKLLPTPKDISRQEMLSKEELLRAINKARDDEGISWSAYFKKIHSQFFEKNNY